MSLGASHALAALLLEHPDLRSARFAFDDRDDFGVRDKGRAREHLAAVLFDEQHVAERQLRTGLASRPVERREAAGLDPQLPPARLNDCVHICTHPKLLSYLEKGLGLKAEGRGPPKGG